MARSFPSLRFSLAGLGSLALLAGCGGGGSGGGVDKPSPSLLSGGTPTVQKLNTPIGLSGSRGAGSKVNVSFVLKDKEFNPTDIQVEYGIDVNGDGLITGSEGDPTPDDEFFPCTPAPGMGDGTVGLDSSAGKGSDHLFVWNSAVDAPARRYVTQDYQYTAQGRLINGSDGEPLFGDTPGIRIRMRANDLSGKPNRWSPWKVTTAFDLNNNTQPAITIDPVGLNGVTPNAAGTADEAVVINIHCIDADTGLGFPDPMAVAVDYAQVPNGTNLADPVQVAALPWTPATTFAGTADTGLDTQVDPGIPHTYTWDSKADVGTVSANYVLRLTPFDSKSELGPTVMQTGVFPLDNYTIFTDSGASLSSGRVGHRATTLVDGRVLVTGGSQTVGGAAVNTAELFFPGVGQTTYGAVAPTASLATARTFHSQTRLQDDRVLVAGGLSSAGTPLNSIEIYDPVAGTWTTLGATLSVARARHTAVLLADGDILFAGGVDASGNPLNSGDVFHFENNTVVAVSNTMAAGRHTVDGALLPDERVLIPGGTGAGGAGLASTVLYDPATNAFSAGPSMGAARSQHSVSAAADGTVIAAGGVGLGSVEVFDPLAGNWITAPGALGAPRAGHAGVLMGNGRILAAGGFDGATVVASADEFVLSTGAINLPNGDEITARRDAAVTILNNGRVLLVGGQGAAGTTLSSIEVYTTDGGFNYAPQAYITTPLEPQSWALGGVFSYRLVDPEQDPAKVVFQYSLNGAPWQACTSKGGPYLDNTNDPDTIAGDINEGTVDLVTAAANSSKPIDPILKNTVGDHLFVWEISADIASADYAAVKVRCLPYGAVAGVGASTTSFAVAQNTRVIPTFEGSATPLHGNVGIWYHLRDIDGANPTLGQPARIEMQYGIDLNGDKQILTDDGETFKTCTEVTFPAGSEGLGANWTLSTSKNFAARGVDSTGWHQFVWDSIKDIGTPEVGVIVSNVILRLTPYDNPGAPDPNAENKGIVRTLDSTGANGLRLELDGTNGLFLTSISNESGSKVYKTFPTPTTGTIPITGMYLDEVISFQFNQPIDPASVNATTLRILVGTREILGTRVVDNVNNRILFYPLLQEVLNNGPKYTRAVGETQTIFFRNDTVSVQIPGYVTGADPTTLTTLRKNVAYVAGMGVVDVANLLPRTYGSAYQTVGTAGVGAFTPGRTGDAPTFLSSTPSSGATGQGTGTRTITVNFQNQVSGESISPTTLRFRVDMNRNGVVDGNDPVVFGRVSMTNTSGPMDGTAKSTLVFTLDSAYTFPVDCQILADFAGIASADGTTAGTTPTSMVLFSMVAGAGTTTTFDEPFTDQSRMDGPNTSGLWATQAFPGVLTQGIDGGTGADGSPTAAANSTLVGSVRTFSAKATWNFSSFTIPKNERWVFTGGSSNQPVTINCNTSVDIAGILDVSGGDGVGRNTESTSYTTTADSRGARFNSSQSAGATLIAGGVGRAGGGKGGDSKAQQGGQAGTAGTGGSSATVGAAGPQYSTTYATGAGGAGHAQTGGTGGYYSGSGVAAGGSAYGTTNFSSGITAGSGGGSGASYYIQTTVTEAITLGGSTTATYYYNWPGGPGGGGGGALKLVARENFTIRGTGVIDASGGDGGNGYYYFSGGGGGGSGGGVHLVCGAKFIQGGIIDIRGGAGGEAYNYRPSSFSSSGITRYGNFGGHGSAGRIYIQAINIGTGSGIPLTNFYAGTSFNSVTLGSLNGGTGSLGAFPSSSTTINVDTAKDASGYLNYSTMNVPSGVTVSFIGTTPARIRVQGSVTLSGVLAANGNIGQPGQYTSSTAAVLSAAVAGPGGGNGGIPNGSGVSTFTRGGNGVGSGGGGGGYPALLWNGSYYYGSSSGGGGANMLNFTGQPWGITTGGRPYPLTGYVSMTGSVHDYYNTGYGAVRQFGPPGVGFNDTEAMTIANMVGGSGGGAGANSGYSIYFYGASGGGSGAGAIGIETTGSFTMASTARFDVIGGNGGSYPYQYMAGAGGGGAGGTVLVRASTLSFPTSGATINAYGGIGAPTRSSGNYFMGSAGSGGIGVARFDTVTIPNLINTGGILGYSSAQATGSIAFALPPVASSVGTSLWQTTSGLLVDYSNAILDKSTSPSGIVGVTLQGAPMNPLTGTMDTNSGTWVSRDLLASPLTVQGAGVTAPFDNVDGLKYFRLIFTLTNGASKAEVTNFKVDTTTR